MTTSRIEPRNLLQRLPEDLSSERTEELLASGSVRIERIVSHGQRSPEGFSYDQAEDEWVLVVSGLAALEIEGRSELVRMGPGDYLYLPAGLRHRVAWTSEHQPTVWLAVFAKPAERADKPER